VIDIEGTIRQLSGNAEAMRALVQSISEEQAQWKPNPDTWSMMEVMAHVYNEERIDFRKHLKEIFNHPPQPWGAFNPEEFLAVASCRQAMTGFLIERQASIAWLSALNSPDWDAVTQANFGPENDVLVLSAGDLLVSWVAHDYLHLRQMIEVLYAWNEQQVSPYSVQYAGGW
jgi:hypothetical protein